MAYDTATDTWSDGLPALAAAHLTEAFGKRVPVGGDVSTNLVTPADTAASRSLAAKLGDYPSVFDFVLPSDSNSDYGPAINRCWQAGHSCFLPTILPVATPLVVPTPGIGLFGRGRTMSGLSVPASALPALNQAGGLITATGLPIGPELTDLEIAFQQPNTGTSWVQYPPWLLLTSTARTRLRSVRAVLGWGGIKSIGSAAAGGGGLLVENLESSCIGSNVALDQCFDTVRFHNPHIWPFGIVDDRGAALHPNATNLFAQFTDAATGYSIGRVDNLDIDNGLTFMRGAMHLMAGSDGNGTFGSVSNHDFDNFGGLTLDAANINFTGCFLTLGDIGGDCIIANNGAVRTVFDGCTWIIGGVPTGNSTYLHCCVQVASGSKVSVVGGRVGLPVDAVVFLADGAATDMIINAVAFDRTPGATYTQPAVVYQNGARPMFNDNTHTVMTASGATFITVSQDAPGTIVGNTFGGAAMSVSSSYTQVQVGLNAGVGSRPS